MILPLFPNDVGGNVTGLAAKFLLNQQWQLFMDNQTVSFLVFIQIQTLNSALQIQADSALRQAIMENKSLKKCHAWLVMFPLDTVYGQNPEKQNPELDKIQKYKIPNGQNPEWTKSRIGQNPEWTKSRMDKIPNWTKSRMDKIPNGQNPEWTKSRIGQNPELDKIQNWTKSKIGQNPELDKIPNRKNPERAKSRI